MTLSHQQLFEEAGRGMKGKTPKTLDWFDFINLPQLTHVDGSQIHPAVVRWWIVSADKQKNVHVNQDLLERLQCLDKPSREALGMYVLDAFIAKDTIRPTEQDADEEAEQRSDNLLEQWHNYARQHAHEESSAYYRDKTLDDAKAQIRGEVLKRYVGSAAKHKGMLSLVTFAPADELLNRVRDFMKQHYTRRAQVEAMLSAIAPNDDPQLIQLLLSTARRNRTRFGSDAGARVG